MPQTISLELSKRLHEKGFKGEYEYVWAYGKTAGPYENKCVTKKTAKLCCLADFPAYQFHEILNFFKKWDIPVALEWIDGEMAACTKDSRDKHDGASLVQHESPVEAIALLLERVIDNG
jgi:hypothetical protein